MYPYYLSFYSGMARLQKKYLQLTSVTWKGTLGHFQNVWRGGWSWATHFDTCQGKKYIFSTNTTCYEVRRKNIRNIRTDLGVYFLNIFKMSECISRDAGHKSSGPSRSCSWEHWLLKIEYRLHRCYCCVSSVAFPFFHHCSWTHSIKPSLQFSFLVVIFAFGGLKLYMLYSADNSEFLERVYYYNHMLLLLQLFLNKQVQTWRKVDLTYPN